MVSIGSYEERPNKIPANIGVLEWTERIRSLQGPVKAFAQDYILDAVLLSHGTSLRKFTYPIPYSQDVELKHMKTKLEEVQILKSDFINEQRFNVEILLTEIVSEKLCAPS